MKSVIDRHVDDISRGLRTFDEVGNIKMKNELADIFIEQYKCGTITGNALNSLIDHYKKQITYFHRIEINDVPESVREIVRKTL